MEIPLDLFMLYIVMIVFGLFAYAVIIPYFVMRKVKKMIYTGEFIQLLESRITVQVSDGKGGTKTREMRVVNYLISVVIHNLKMQINGLKASFIRSS